MTRGRTNKCTYGGHVPKEWASQTFIRQLSCELLTTAYALNPAMRSKECAPADTRQLNLVVSNGHDRSQRGVALRGAAHSDFCRPEYSIA